MKIDLDLKEKLPFLIKYLTIIIIKYSYCVTTLQYLMFLWCILF